MGEWQPISTAPKDNTRIDLWAKTWRSKFDDFVGQRFTNCYWDKGDPMVNSRPQWVGVPNSWHPTHWMPLPGSPEL